MTVNPIRHQSIYDPAKFGTDQIFVIGAGATGSKVVAELAKLGCTNITVWDFDKVEEHNIANQLYGPKHIGVQKVEACKEVVNFLTGTDIVTRDEAFTGQEAPQVLFILTDTMSSRKEIWDAVKDEIDWELIVETRMDATQCRVQVMTPDTPFEKYEATLYDDDQAVESACGAQVTVGPTASALAAMAVWAYIEWRQEETPPPPSEMIYITCGHKLVMEERY